MLSMFGTACTVFQSDNSAAAIHREEHLQTWTFEGTEVLVDRYDARLLDTCSYEPSNVIDHANNTAEVDDERFGDLDRAEGVITPCAGIMARLQ